LRRPGGPLSYCRCLPLGRAMNLLGDRGFLPPWHPERVIFDRSDRTDSGDQSWWNVQVCRCECVEYRENCASCDCATEWARTMSRTRWGSRRASSAGWSAATAGSIRTTSRRCWAFTTCQGRPQQAACVGAGRCGAELVLLDSRVPAMWRDLARFEHDAIVIHYYETMMIPGMLQTAEYMTALAHAMYDDVTEEETNRLVAARMERQALLKKTDGPGLFFLIEETVLRRQTSDPGVMHRRSASRCGRLVRRTGVDDQQSLLYVAQRSNESFVEKADHVTEARKAFRRLRSVALSREDSVDFIDSLGNELPDVVEEPHDGKLGLDPC
jgi:Domain of unknown function (DUF5753)